MRIRLLMMIGLTLGLLTLGRHAAQARAAVYFPGPDEECIIDTPCGTTTGNLFAVVSQKGNVLFRCQAPIPPSCDRPMRALRLSLSCEDVFEGELLVNPAGWMIATCHGQVF